MTAEFSCTGNTFNDLHIVAGWEEGSGKELEEKKEGGFLTGQKSIRIGYAAKEGE